MQDRLVRVETKLDLLIAELHPRHSDHEARIRALEVALSDVKVRVALVAGGTGTVASVITAVLAHYLGATP